VRNETGILCGSLGLDYDPMIARKKFSTLTRRRIHQGKPSNIHQMVTQDRKGLDSLMNHSSLAKKTWPSCLKMAKTVGIRLIEKAKGPRFFHDQVTGGRSGQLRI